jgi:hypothetical protein
LPAPLQKSDRKEAEQIAESVGLVGCRFVRYSPRIGFA